MRRITALSALGFALVVSTPSAWAQTSANPPTPSSRTSEAGSEVKPSVDPSYVLGAGDIVEVGIVGRDDFNARVRVGADGKVLLPYIGSLTAAKRSTLELADDIRKALIAGGYFSSPVVRAEVVGIASRYATVLGAVGNPGLIPLDRTYHLSEILARVGGRASGGAEYVVLTRAGGAQPERFSIAELASGTASSDPVIQPGDKVFVPSGEDEVVYVSGEVKTPGSYHVSPGMTLRMAIARGGGVTENGSDGRVTVTRGGKKVKVKLDEPVQVGDVITVGERLF